MASEIADADTVTLPTLSRLANSLSLECIAQSDVFTGEGIVTEWGRMFGGQVLGQCVMAGTATVLPEYKLHSLHGYFLLAGKNDTTIMFKVERLRDGRSFVTRAVQALQENRCIFTVILQFHRVEFGPEFQIPFKELRAYVRMRLEEQYRGNAGQQASRIQDSTSNFIGISFPEELIARGTTVTTDPTGCLRMVQVAQGDRWKLWWCRHNKTLPRDISLHRAILAYMSDLGAASVARQPYENKVETRMLMSLDHTIHFHRDVCVDEWLLFHVETSTSSKARGLVTGKIFTTDAILVASLLQEALVRVAMLEEGIPVTNRELNQDQIENSSMKSTSSTIVTVDEHARS